MPPPRPPELSPILVEGLGRSGTTLLMQLLGTSPRIGFDRHPPFETRYLLYFVRWAEQLRLPYQPREGWTQKELEYEPEIHVGPFPWPSRDSVASPAGEEDLAIRALRAIWREFSPLAARNVMPEEPNSVRYYAEKATAWLVDLVLNLGPTKVIALARDPRDVWLSAAAFDAKRGFSGFGRLPDQSMEEWLEVFLDTQRQHLERITAREDSDTFRLVRYEDLVTDLHGCAHSLSDWLDVELDAEQVLEAQAGMREHMTSTSPTASIGRWRAEMDATTARRFDESLGPVLARLDYSASSA